MKKLIVNADDFGLHTEVNKAVIKGYQQGCLRSTSLMPTGAAVEEASQLARQNPELGIGIHITLVAEKPVLPLDKVSTLVDEQGHFHADHMVLSRNICRDRLTRDSFTQSVRLRLPKLCPWA